MGTITIIRKLQIQIEMEGTLVAILNPIPLSTDLKMSNSTIMKNHKKGHRGSVVTHKAKHQLATPTVLGLPIFRYHWNHKFPILSIQRMKKMITEPQVLLVEQRSQLLNPIMLGLPFLWSQHNQKFTILPL